MNQTEATPNITISQASNFKPKRPLPLLLISICFLLAPFINLASALFVGGHLQWFNPVVWANLFQKLSTPEQALMISDILVAILLFFQNRRSWLLAIVLVVATTVYNILSQKNEHGADVFQVLSFINIAATFGVFAILYFFRYPYLDKRDSILSGPTKRTKVQISAQLLKHGNCLIVDISKTGCKIVIENPSNEKLELGSKVELILPNAMKISCEVIHLDKGYGLKFNNLNRATKNKIAEWIP